VKLFVLDASVALAWFIDHSVPPYAIRARQALLRGDRALVPALWHLEMANGLIVAERRRILKSDDVNRCLASLEQLLAQAIESSSDFVPMRQVLATGRTFKLSAYDAVYLDTARRERLPLATLDQQLQSSAAAAGVELFA
jgi:predicted nucleic acid-binding protein